MGIYTGKVAYATSACLTEKYLRCFSVCTSLHRTLRVQLSKRATKVKYPSGDGYFTLVSHVDITWNSFLPYLINLADKLESLGFRYVDGSVIVNKEEK